MFNRTASLERETLIDLLNQVEQYRAGGVPAVDALAILKAGSPRAEVRRCLQTLQDSAANSPGFADGLTHYPRVFYPFLTEMLREAEQDGRGPALLQQCTTYLAGILVLDRSGRNALKSVTYYPLIMGFLLFLLVALLMIFVVPTLEDLFRDFGGELPALTRGVIAFAEWFSGYGWGVLGIMLLIHLLWRSARARWPALAPLSGRLWRRVPVFGSIYARTAQLRLLRTVAFMLKANRRLPDALAAAEVVVAPPYAQALSRVRAQVLGGSSLTEALRASLRKENLFPQPLIEAATVGERTQTLAAVLDVLADRYQRELQSPLLARSLEVFLMVLLAVLVGIVVIAMYLPIFVLASAV